MQNSWSLRDELLAASQRWPLILLYVLAGALLGLVASYLVPVQHQASLELYVGLDVYRAFEDRNVPIEALTAIDYKNWQMENLELLTQTGPVLDATLAALRQQDPYWEAVQPADLLGMLQVNYRSAGQWRLIAVHGEPERASQAVAAWESAVLEAVQAALAQTQQVYALDARLQALAVGQAGLAARQSQLETIVQDLRAWSALLVAQPADVPLEAALRWQGWAPLSLGGLEADLQPLAQTFPAIDAPVGAYRAWLEQAVPALDSELERTRRQAESLQVEIEALTLQYSEASRRSLALSANLVLQRLSDQPPQLQRQRPVELLLLSGALLGLCVWLALWLGRVALRSQDAMRGQA